MTTASTRQTRRFGVISSRQQQPVYKYSISDNPDFPKIVLDIIDGLQIQKVDPELYMGLLPHLESRFEALKDWQNQPATRNVIRAINYIRDYGFDEEKQQQLPVSERAISQRSGKITENIINTSMDLALSGNFELIDPRLYKTLNRKLMTLKKESVKTKDYGLAQRAGGAARKVIAMNDENKFSIISAARLEQRENTLMQQENSRDVVVKDWDEKIKEAEKQRTSDIQEIKHQGEVELAEFDKKFDVEPPKVIYKFSPKLLEMKVIEDHLAKAERYDEATSLSKEIEQLEKVEMENLKKIWFDRLKMKRGNFQKNVNQKMQIRERNADKKIEFMKLKAGNQIEQQDKAVDHATGHLESAELIYSYSNNPPRDKARTATRTTRSIYSNLPATASETSFRKKAIINQVIYTKTQRL